MAGSLASMAGRLAQRLGLARPPAGPLPTAQDFADVFGPVASGFHSETRGQQGFRGAQIDSQTRNWIPASRAGDSYLRDSWPLLTARIGDLIRNEPSLGQAKRALVKHIIRTGIATYADAVDGEGESIDDFNFESDEWFDRWADDEADIEGRHAWPELQWHAHDQVIEKGEAILLKCMDRSPGRTMPLAYQLLEPEQLDANKEQPADDRGVRIVRGVELNANNRAIAYWIFDCHPFADEGWCATSSRVPAERVIHYYMPFTQSATRGISWFHALVRATRDVDWFLGSELTAAALGALLVMVHKVDKMPNSGGLGGFADNGQDNDIYGNPLVKLGAGTKATISKNDELELVESKRPGRQIGPFMQLMRQEQAMGAGLSYLSLTGDFSQTSFTSAHGAANEERAYFLPLQQRFGRRVVAPVRREHTRMAAALGLFSTISAKQFRDQQHRWSRITVQPPGRDQLNPLDQTDASGARIRMGLSTLKDECGLEGKNWRRNILQRKREDQFAARHGVQLDFSKGAGDPLRALSGLQRSQADQPSPASDNTLPPEED